MKFTKSKKANPVELEQHDLLERARGRVIRKKRVYQHFAAFLVGSAFFVLLNRAFGVWPEYDWYIAGIGAWLFLLCLHAIQVFFFDEFMGKEWERRQRERLVEKQKARIAEIQKEIETEFPISKVNKNETT